jgi:hypothetical protein
MLGRLALLAKSKLAVTLVGTMLVAGGGTTAALAASGTHLQLPLVSQSQSQAHHDNDAAGTDDHQSNQSNQSNQQGTNHDDGQQAEGTISSIDAGHSTFVLAPEQGTTVTVVVNGQTIFEEGLSAFSSLKVGQHVEVKGTRQSDGSLLATKVEGQSEAADDDQGQNADQDNNENELKGAVVSVDTGKSSFVLKLTDGTTKTIRVSVQTEFDGGFHSLSDLKAGQLVQVTGNLQSDGTVAASNVHREDDTSGSGGSDGPGGGSGDGSSSGNGGNGGNGGSGGSGDGH